MINGQKLQFYCYFFVNLLLSTYTNIWNTYIQSPAITSHVWERNSSTLGSDIGAAGWQFNYKMKKVQSNLFFYIREYNLIATSWQPAESSLLLQRDDMHRRVALISAEWLKLIAMCGICRHLKTRFRLQLFKNLSESDCSLPEWNGQYLETGSSCQVTCATLLCLNVVAQSDLLNSR